jgi:hypothetical protein
LKSSGKWFRKQRNFMGDYFPGSIEIGGTITRAVYNKLFKLAQSYGFEWADVPDDPDDLLKAIAGKPLEITDPQASGGMFPDIEEFCQENGLTFRRHSDSYCEYEAEIVWWEPGMDETAYTLATSNDEVPVVLLSEVETAMKQKSEAARTRAFKQLIKRHTPVNVPPLEVIPNKKRTKRK